ncbi:MAG: hypothetical protein ABI790_15050 [Betaproteobacteria bacterium]
MANAYICETVNSVENNFAADSRDKTGKRVVMFDSARTQQIYLFPAHIVQIEAVVDSRDGVERSVISMSSGLRYITARGAAAICGDMAKLM